MNSICSLTIEQLRELLVVEGEKPFHAEQILDWIYKKGVMQWDRMTNLSHAFIERISKRFTLNTLTLVKVSESKDLETFKFLWRLPQGDLIESVLICAGDRRTVCVSSQVGCPAKCAFCASGQGGFMRNLTSAEIVEQVLHINSWLMEKGEKVSNIVYMGMGEPFKNYKEVVKSIRLLTEPTLMGLSDRRITVSTVGVIEGIRQLAEEGLKVNLVLSLHAPNQKIREKIIPYARKYPLDQILDAMDYYAEKTKRDITYEYILLAGINDHPDHAFELANLIKTRQCTVNLIPYNPIPGRKLVRPDAKAIKAFRSVLFGCKISNTTIRYTKGDDIAAACGQLALQEREAQSGAI